MMSKSVRISLPLLDQIIELLRHWEGHEHDHPLCDVYDDVFWTLISIQNKVALKYACKKILKASSPQALDEAYTVFRQLKIYILDAQEGIPF
jgi:hypothetical protein